MTRFVMLSLLTSNTALLQIGKLSNRPNLSNLGFFFFFFFFLFFYVKAYLGINSMKLKQMAYTI